MGQEKEGRQGAKKNGENGGFPVRETIKLYGRMLGLVWRRFPQSLVSSGLHRMARAFTPYIPLYFTARFLDELAGARRQEILVKWVALLLALSFAATLVKHLLACWDHRERVIFFWEQQSDFYSRKLLDADFKTVDDATVLDRLTQIEQHQNFMGYGINQFRIHLENIWESLFQILGGALLSCSMFTFPLAEQYRENVWIQRGLWGILLPLLLTVPLPALFSRGERRRVQEHVRAGVESNRAFFAYGFDLFTNRKNALDMRTYRQDIFGDKMLDVHGRRAAKNTENILHKGMGSVYRIGAEVSPWLMMAFIYTYVCVKAWFGAFGVGSVTRYVGAVHNVAKGISTLLKEVERARTNAPFLKNIFDFLDIPNEMYQGSLTVEKRRDRNYEVEFRDVSFRYPNAPDYALRHVSVKFQVGERLAVVGQNGSGKTTFIKLLCRLYDPTEGQILLNGIDIRKYDYREYQSLFSVVFQDFQLLAFPLGQNVAASISYDAGRVKECLEKAGMGEWLKNHPGGLNMKLYENMSGGKKAEIPVGENTRPRRDVAAEEGEKISVGADTKLRRNVTAGEGEKISAGMDTKLQKNVTAGEGEKISAGMDTKLQKNVAAGEGEKISVGEDTRQQKSGSADEGVELSGGEEQKIAIARSMYRNAPFVILDEPTAALDPVSEYEVYTHFDDIVTDCTAIYISHRLSSCRFCDEIMVFHQGSVIERGTHEALLEKGGKYSELWNAQAQYYV